MKENKDFFPIFLDISKKRVLFVGAGSVACRRIEKLIEYACKITVVAPSCDKAIEEWNTTGRLKVKKREFRQMDLMDADIVFICTDDEKLNHEIWLSCKDRALLVNNSSNKAECDFHFPAIIETKESTIAMNSNGNPAKTRKLRERLSDMFC